MRHWLSGERVVSCPSTLVLVDEQLNSHHSYCLLVEPHNLTEGYCRKLHEVMLLDAPSR